MLVADITRALIGKVLGHYVCVIAQASSVKKAGDWPSSLFAFLWIETKSRSINMQKENE